MEPIWKKLRKVTVDLKSRPIFNSLNVPVFKTMCQRDAIILRIEKGVIMKNKCLNINNITNKRKILKWI